ncbi:MAG: hypothetical protein V4757_07150 [Pseudomonadota bacterium]
MTTYIALDGVPIYGGRFAPVIPTDPEGPDPDAPAITLVAVGNTSVLHFNAWHLSSRYTRDQKPSVFTAVNSGTTATMRFHVTNFAAGGTVPALAGTEYKLMVDGVERAIATLGPSNAYGDFIVPVGLLTTGWHELDIAGNAPSGEHPVKWFCYVHRVGQADASEVIPVCHGSYEVGFLSIARPEVSYAYAYVPRRFTPQARPMVPRETPPFSTAVARTNLFLENITVYRSRNIYRPNRQKDGIWTTTNIQPYHFTTLVHKYPKMPLLDGPRGIGTVSMLTHIQVDRHGGAYACHPWGVVRIDKQGTVTTRAGFRHKDVASNWLDAEDQYTLELVGDWSSIPADRHGFHETWGIAIDQDSVSTATLDTSAAQQPNPLEGGALEHPHTTGPRFFIADSQNNRVCLLTFSRDSFTAEPVVTEFITGLADPWDCIWDNGFLYVSERKAHRIVKYNATTGAFVEVMVEKTPIVPAEAYIDTNRFPQVENVEARNPGDPPKMAMPIALARRRLHPCLLPEGLYLQDGWLYFASSVLANVRRVNLTTKVVEDYATFSVDDNTRFAKFSMSDGTFGPRGTVFVSNWTVGNYGFPEARLPGNTRWPLSVNGAFTRGKGGVWHSLSYASASGCGMGKLFMSSADEGLVQLSLALPSDVTPNSTQTALYKQGEDEWYRQGKKLVHGDYGYDYHGFPLPWGKTEAMDYYLTANGHVRPET